MNFGRKPADCKVPLPPRKQVTQSDSGKTARAHDANIITEEPWESIVAMTFVARYGPMPWIAVRTPAASLVLRHDCCF